MKLKLSLGFLFFIIFLAVSCNKDEFRFESVSQRLKFSSDTVFCDTVCSQVRSETYFVKVYNREDKNVRIPRIFLELGSSSQYKINVDGKSGYDFYDVPLRAKDSLYVFIEIAPNISVSEAIVEDKIKFNSPAGTQDITLFSVVQDAEFFISTADHPKIISQNTTWNNNKAKIVFGDLILADGKTLDIEEGTKVYFHKNSGMKISKNAILNVNGDLNREVIFRGDRNSLRYDTLPKNWNGITFEKDSKLNMNYAKMLGGTTALSFNESQVNIKNSIIHTFQEYGIYAENTALTAENLVMNLCGESDLAIFRGGAYNIAHSTLANYWSLSHQPALGIYARNDLNGALAPFSLTLKNSIVYNRGNNAVVLRKTAGQVFNYLFHHSLIKYDTSSSGFTWDGNTYIVSSFKNLDPLFLKTNSEQLNLRLAQNSPARAIGNLATAQSIPLDVKKINRTTNPNLGAYQ